MVLGSIDPEITYPMSLYYSTKGCGCNYIRGTLTIDPGGWDEANSKFLAEIFGFNYERILPNISDQIATIDQVWNGYLGRIWAALNEGSAVQICQGWVGEQGQDAWWGGGMENTPDMHYITAVGMDRRAGRESVYIHDPIGGWFGTGRYYTVLMDSDDEDETTFTKMSEACHLPQHKYITITYYPKIRPIGHSRKVLLGDPDTTVQRRIQQRLMGNPEVYDGPETWQEFFGSEWSGDIRYGQEGLEFLKGDLDHSCIGEKLGQLESAIGMHPLDTISYLDLGVYHYSYITSISSEYLEELGRIKEWEWLFKLHLLYEHLWIATSNIRSIFKRYYQQEKVEPLSNAVNDSRDYLDNMQRIIDKMIYHFDQYRAAVEP